MSDQPAAAPSAAPRSAPRSTSGGGTADLLKRKVGPIPVWGYGVVLTALLVWRWYAAHKAGASASSGTSTTGNTATSGDTGTPADQVPQYVNQTYTTLIAPSAPGGSVQPPPAPKPAPKVHQFPAPVNVKATSPTRNGVTLSWQARPSGSIYPQSSTVEIFNAKGKAVYQGSVNSPDTTGGITTTTVTGLPRNTPLHARVWSNGGELAPPGVNVQFRTAA